VLGKNPGHIRTDFKSSSRSPATGKSEPFTQLVDYIYKVLTKPDVTPAEAPDQQAGPKIRDPAPDATIRCCPTPVPAALPGLLELS